MRTPARTYAAWSRNYPRVGGLRPTNPIFDRARGSFAPLEDELLQFPDGTRPKQSVPIDFRFHQDWPWHPIYLRRFRRFFSLVDALGDYSRRHPSRTPLSRLRRDLAFEMATALAEWPFDYTAANKVLNNWRKRAQGQQARKQWRQLLGDFGELQTLISAYGAPRRFFENTAPMFPEFQFGTPEALGNLLWMFGFGALLNPDVRAAIDSCSDEDIIEVLARAEGREAFRDGRPRKPRVAPGKRRGRPPLAIPSPDTQLKRNWRAGLRKRPKL
jgi:hypothetical protein